MAKKQKINNPVKRPPVVVVMGHVDHGKTTLLDFIRKAHVQAGEAGGITQHIGAYQAEIKKDNSTSLITFIDTPGHEAFSKMRSRGAKVADLAILVVAANDGVKPQTKEAISHIKKANIPFIVAINKIDLEGINLDVVKSQLAENDVIVEDYGGDIVSVPISAKLGKGVDQLLEMLNLLWELQDIKENHNNLNAVVLESFINPARGVIANVLIRSGEINLGDILYCQNKKAKVRCLLNQKSVAVTKAIASQPIQILGFKEVLPVGEILTKKEILPEIEKEIKKEIIETKKSENEEQQQKLKIILKADVAGTLEAIKTNLTEEIDLIDEGIGDISDSDVLLARSTNSRIIGFNVRIHNDVKKLAEMEEVKIQTFNIIYHLLEDLQKRVLKLLEPTINEEILGTADVIAEFTIHKVHIAGCKVTKGSIVRSEKVKVISGEKTYTHARIAALQVERKDEKQATKDQEVAIVFRPDLKFKIGDQIISYKIIED